MTDHLASKLHKLLKNLQSEILETVWEFFCLFTEETTQLHVDRI